jgi:hypothetical protein
VRYLADATPSEPSWHLPRLTRHSRRIGWWRETFTLYAVKIRPLRSAADRRPETADRKAETGVARVASEEAVIPAR